MKKCYPWAKGIALTLLAFALSPLTPRAQEEQPQPPTSQRGVTPQYNVDLTDFVWFDCGTTPGWVEIANYGLNPTSDVEVEMRINGDLVNTIEVDVILESGEMLIQELPLYALTPADVLEVKVVFPLDMFPEADVVTYSPSVLPSGPGRLRLVFTTDETPDQNSWEIIGPDGTTVLQGQPSLPIAENQYEYYLGTPGCYTFKVHDSEGNGLNTWWPLEAGISLHMLNDEGQPVEELLDYSGGWLDLLHVSFEVAEILEQTFEVCTYHDWNENGIWDDAEPAIPNVPIQIGPLALTTTADGCVTNEAAEVSVVAVQQDPDAWPLVTTPSEYVLDGAEVNNTYYTFGLSSGEDFFHASITLSQWEDYLCESSTPLFLTIENLGNTPLSGSVVVEIDPLLTIDPGLGSIGAEVTGQQVVWNIDNIPVGEHTHRHFFVTAPTFESLGEWATNTATFNMTDANGNDVGIETSEHTHEITCAYDPNDKQVWPQGEGENGVIPITPTTFEYLIRFQNTGNAPATDIRVDDDIDPDLDWTSFEVIATSHTCEPSINMLNGHAEFFFPDIQLPDSTNNEPESHGFVRYRISSVDDVFEGMVIENTASIFFDSNPPIVTNTTVNTFSDGSGSSVVELEGARIAVYPNPTEDVLNVSVSSDAVEQILLVGLDGKTVHSQRVLGPQSLVSTQGLAAGLYLLRATDAYGHTLATTRVVKR